MVGKGKRALHDLGGVYLIRKVEASIDMKQKWGGEGKRSTGKGGGPIKK